MDKVVVKLTEEENIVLSARLVRRLTETKSGDACLLYLWLKRSKGAMDENVLRTTLAWEAERFEQAKKTLSDAGLVHLHEAQEHDGATEQDGSAQQHAAPERREAPPAPPREEKMPEYSDEDVIRRIEGDKDFAALLRETERKIGVLSAASVKMLLGLRDYLGLPNDVIYLLINECIARKEELFGEGRRPTMREIEQEGYAWARRELYSAGAVDEYLKKKQLMRRMFPDYQRALQITGRTLSPSEYRYVSQWAEMGFPPETLAIAYDKTVLKCHEFRWSYCDGIMKRWHSKNLHTPPEVLSENGGSGGGKAAKKEEEQKELSRKAGMSRYI